MEQINKIKEKLTQLNFTQKLAYATGCAYRSLPNYNYFSQIENWGNPVFFTDSIHLFENTIEKGITENIELQIQKRLVDILTVTPDSNDFPSVHCTYAMDTSIVFYEIFSFILDRDENHIEMVVDTYFNTLYIFLTDKYYQENLSISDEIIYADELMSNEVAYQLELIEFLTREDLSTNTLQIIKKIRNQKSNIGLT